MFTLISCVPPSLLLLFCYLKDVWLANKKWTPHFSTSQFFGCSLNRLTLTKNWKDNLLSQMLGIKWKPNPMIMWLDLMFWNCYNSGQSKTYKVMVDPMWWHVDHINRRSTASNVKPLWNLIFRVTYGSMQFTFTSLYYENN